MRRPFAGRRDHADAGRAHEDGCIRSRLAACKPCGRGRRVLNAATRCPPAVSVLLALVAARRRRRRALLSARAASVDDHPRRRHARRVPVHVEPVVAAREPRRPPHEPVLHAPPLLSAGVSRCSSTQAQRAIGYALLASVRDDAEPLPNRWKYKPIDGDAHAFSD